MNPFLPKGEKGFHSTPFGFSHKLLLTKQQWVQNNKSINYNLKASEEQPKTRVGLWRMVGSGRFKGCTDTALQNNTRAHRRKAAHNPDKPQRGIVTPSMQYAVWHIDEGGEGGANWPACRLPAPEGGMCVGATSARTWRTMWCTRPERPQRARGARAR